MPPPEGSTVDWDDRYGSAASPKSKNADIALVHQTLWQLPPVNKLRITRLKENDNGTKPITNKCQRQKQSHLLISTVLKIKNHVKTDVPIVLNISYGILKTKAFNVSFQTLTSDSNNIF